jgi:glutamate N-acetyltransferase/amino-acid N-acetyltransferase
VSDNRSSPAELPEFETESHYREYLESVSRLPAGFRVSTGNLSFVPSERPTLEPYRMNLSLILADRPVTSFAGVFTKNAFPGAPVILGRRRLSEPALRAVLVNNKIANVRAANGLRDAELLGETLAARLGILPGETLSVSTGIIGWKLPVPEIQASIPDLVDRLHDGSALEVADAIMTTDSFPKVRRLELETGTLLGIAKGAGMVEPDMATMLAFILTDVGVDRDVLRRCLSRAVADTFNQVSVDGDMSTSDMVLVLSSGDRPPVAESAFERALTELCGQLASDIVRNGEGTGHVIRVEVSGMADDEHARAAAKAVVNSPLVKTAIYGNDPNVGRILSAIGDFAGTRGIPVDPGSVRIDLGTETVFDSGAFAIDREKEIRLSEYLKYASLNPRLRGFPQHQRTVDIRVSCGDGAGIGHAIGADLSDQYVRENADYRT